MGRRSIGLWSLPVFVIVWQLVAALLVQDSTLLPTPVTVADTAFADIRSGDMIDDVVASLVRVLIGYSIALAVSAAVLAGAALSPHVRMAVRPIAEVLRPIPPIAWVPLAILWLGLGDKPAIFIVALGAGLPMTLAALDAVGSVDERETQVAQSLGLHPGQIVRHVVLPAANAQFAVGARIGLGIAWTSVIAAELVGAQSGLGYSIQQSRLLLQTERVVAGMVAIGVLGYALSAISYRIEAFAARRSL